MDSWQRVCYKRPIAYYFKTSLLEMAARNLVSIFSNQRRFTNFEGEWYEYPYHPDAEQMENEVTRLLDGCNERFDLCTKHLKHGVKDFDDFYFLFKTCAWLLFELLDLHPFGQGNGRLCRILSSYLLSTFSPSQLQGTMCGLIRANMIIKRHSMIRETQMKDIRLP